LPLKVLPNGVGKRYNISHGPRQALNAGFIETKSILKVWRHALGDPAGEVFAIRGQNFT
jgi:hypothetical protein